MLLRHRPPGIDTTAPVLRAGLEHLDGRAVAVLRWLAANKIDFVVVGPVGHAIRGDLDAQGAVAIVPAPYERNYDRLARALIAEHAGLRSESRIPGGSSHSETVPVKLTGEKLARGRRWMLRFGDHDLDIERSASRPGSGSGSASGAADGERREPGTVPPAEEAHHGSAAGARYQELLYEATRFELADDVAVQVAAPEDLERYSHVRRTGTDPEFRVTRNLAAEEAPPAAPAEPRAASAEAPPAAPAQAPPPAAPAQAPEAAPPPDA